MANQAAEEFIRVGTRVYFTAFPKQTKDIFFVCGGIIIKSPDKKDRQIYKVKIDEVGLTRIGGTEEQYDQVVLIGKVITKKFSELNQCAGFMMPKAWVRIVRDG